jgi:hypothetical protein
MLRRAISLKLCAENKDIIQLNPFIHAFYVLESFLFYNHQNCEGDVMVIPPTMGTHQGDPLKGELFALTHFKALCFITSHCPSYLFP